MIREVSHVCCLEHIFMVQKVFVSTGHIDIVSSHKIL